MHSIGVSGDSDRNSRRVMRVALWAVDMQVGDHPISRIVGGGWPLVLPVVAVALVAIGLVVRSRRRIRKAASAE